MNSPTQKWDAIGFHPQPQCLYIPFPCSDPALVVQSWENLTLIPKNRQADGDKPWLQAPKCAITRPSNPLQNNEITSTRFPGSRLTYMGLSNGPPDMSLPNASLRVGHKQTTTKPPPKKKTRPMPQKTTENKFPPTDPPEDFPCRGEGGVGGRPIPLI